MHSSEDDKPYSLPTATLIFSPQLAIQLEDDRRLPGHCIGTRKVRAGSKLVLDILKSEKRARKEAHRTTFARTSSIGDGVFHQPCIPTTDPGVDPVHLDVSATQAVNEGCKHNSVTFKIMGEDGVERRMTVKEKKEYKKLLKKSQRNGATGNTVLQTPGPDMTSGTTPLPTKSHSSSSNPKISPTLTTIKREYHQMMIDTQSLQAELDQIRGERQGIMPIMLSPPLSRQFHLSSSATASATTTSTSSPNHFIQVDDTLSFHWAQVLKRNLRFAEDIRSREDLRPLAYTITPEVWVRLRPWNTHSNPQPWIYNMNTLHITEEKDRKPWILAWTRPPCTTTNTSSSDPEITLDEKLSMIHSCLYHMAQSENEPSLKKDIYISCGAKFGSDYLLYDGNRQSRHAFAGLRCIHSRNGDMDKVVDGNLSWEDARVEDMLPQLSPYDIAGYVRGLNTAGKLSLVATVVTKRYNASSSFQERPEIHESQPYHVENSTPYYIHHIALVDLALEKVLDAPTHLKKSPKLRKPRKDMGLNLDKTKK